MSTTPYDDLAKQCIEDAPHYTTAVTAMADRTEVLATADILANNGTKLVAQGTLLNSGLREGLLKHKLLKPIDEYLSVRDGVTPESLARDANNLLAGNASLCQLSKHSLDPLAMRHGLARLALPPLMAFKLTVARTERPVLYAHLLTVALFANYFALRLELPERDTSMLLAAALYHDLGELHTDPAMLDPKHKISELERRFIYVHPITSYLIAQGAGDVPSAVLAAILQHHERLDGSGYPNGLPAEKITRFARILGISDVAASITSRSQDAGRFAALIRLNRNKYDARLLSILQQGLAGAGDDPAAPATDIVAQLQAMAALLDGWDRLKASFTAGNHADPPAVVQFLFDRMFALRSHVLEFGFDPDSLAVLVELAQTDNAVAAELVTVMEELHWQLADLAHEVERRRASVVAALAAERWEELEGWLADLQRTLPRQ